MFEAKKMKKHYLSVIGHIAYLCEKATESNEFEVDYDNLFFRDLIRLSDLFITLKELYKEAFGEEVDEPLADSVNGVNDAKSYSKIS